jgi:nucleotide-binding universal stress UspA family protein
MIRKIVVPLDGTAASEKILPHLAELFRVADADIRFIHVSDWTEKGLKRGREYLENLGRKTTDQFPFMKTELLHGEPAFEILKYAVTHHADLIAMMTCTRTTMGKLLFGSTAVELMRRCQVPIFLARPTWPARPIRKILVPLDGSSTSQEILPIVGDLAHGAGAKVALLTVLPNPELRAPAGRALKRVAGIIARKGIPVESILASGEAVKEIMSAAQDGEADVIALGTHGRRGSNRFFFGSVAEAVLKVSKVPVLLRRKPRRIGGTAPTRVAKVAQGS